MHDSIPLYPNPIVGVDVVSYATKHSTPLPDILYQHQKASEEFCEKENLPAVMMVSEIQAQFMLFIAKLQRAKRILEIGTFTGYSALAWAEAVKTQPGGEVVCLDLENSASEFAKESFKKAGYGDIIKFVGGDATETMKTLSGTFDIIFIDANKDGYVSYLDIALSLNLLAPGGLIIADNALFMGLPANRKDNPEQHDSRWTNAADDIDRFNKWVNDRVDLENILLPVFDGVHLVRRKDVGEAL